MEKRVWYTASSNGIGRIYNASIRDEHVDAKGIFIIVLSGFAFAHIFTAAFSITA